LNVLN